MSLPTLSTCPTSTPALAAESHKVVPSAKCDRLCKFGIDYSPVLETGCCSHFDIIIIHFVSNGGDAFASRSALNASRQRANEWQANRVTDDPKLDFVCVGSVRI